MTTVKGRILRPLAFCPIFRTQSVVTTANSAAARHTRRTEFVLAFLVTQEVQGAFLHHNALTDIVRVSCDYPEYLPQVLGAFALKKRF
jgi:hypothetical protein